MKWEPDGNSRETFRISESLAYTVSHSTAFLSIEDSIIVLNPHRVFHSMQEVKDFCMDHLRGMSLELALASIRLMQSE